MKIIDTFEEIKELEESLQVNAEAFFMKWKSYIRG